MAALRRENGDRHHFSLVTALRKGKWCLSPIFRDGLTYDATRHTLGGS
jgi:hypothetical protein